MHVLYIGRKESNLPGAGSSVAVAGSVTAAAAGVSSFLLFLLLRRLFSFAFRLEKAIGAV